MMNMFEFVENIPADQLVNIYKNYFEQHLIAYDILHGVEFIDLRSIDIDKASIIYSVKVLNDSNKEALVRKLNSTSAMLNIYGSIYKPHVYLNGDLLCITIKK